MGQHRHHAGHGQRGGAIDAGDGGMGMRAAYKHRMGLAPKMQIVRVLTLTGDEAQILAALDRLADAEFHGSLLPARLAPGACLSKALAGSSRRNGLIPRCEIGLPLAASHWSETAHNQGVPQDT